MPLISVIVPAYNAERTIGETIRSVLAQTFADFELIIVNDGSQDKTLEVISQFFDARIQVFSYSNAGLATSRNRGISHASGEFISFLDADDLWTPDKLEKQLQALNDNSQAAVVYSWTNCIDESGQFVRRGSHLSVSGNVYATLLVVNFIENGSNPMIRKQALEVVGNFDPALTPAEDRDMWLRLAAKYEFIVVPAPQILYRQSPGSVSSNVLKQAASSLAVLQRAFQQAPLSLQYLRARSLANIYKYFVFKSLEGIPNTRKGIATANFIFQAIRYDPSLLKHRVLIKVICKTVVVISLPSRQAQALITKSKKFFNITQLLSLTRIDINP